MTQRHCFVTQVGDAIEALASALDPDREKPFRGDILDLLEWAAKDVLAMRAEIAVNDLNEPNVDHAEYKTWWELALHVGAWKDHDFDYVHFGSEAAVRAYTILLLRQRDEYELEQFNTIEVLRQQVTLLRDALKQARHMIYYGEPQIGWNITRIDEVIDATKEQ